MKNTDFKSCAKDVTALSLRLELTKFGLNPSDWIVLPFGGNYFWGFPGHAPDYFIFGKTGSSQDINACWEYLSLEVLD